MDFGRFDLRQKGTIRLERESLQGSPIEPLSERESRLILFDCPGKLLLKDDYLKCLVPEIHGQAEEWNRVLLEVFRLELEPVVQKPHSLWQLKERVKVHEGTVMLAQAGVLTSTQTTLTALTALVSSRLLLDLDAKVASRAQTDKVVYALNQKEQRLDISIFPGFDNRPALQLSGELFAQCTRKVSFLNARRLDRTELKVMLARTAAELDMLGKQAGAGFAVLLHAYADAYLRRQTGGG